MLVNPTEITKEGYISLRDLQHVRTPFCDIAVYYFADFYFDTNKENEENDTVSVNTVSENDTVSVHQIILFNNYSSKQQSFLCRHLIGRLFVRVLLLYTVYTCTVIILYIHVI